MSEPHAGPRLVSCACILRSVPRPVSHTRILCWAGKGLGSRVDDPGSGHVAVTSLSQSPHVSSQDHTWEVGREPFLPVSFFDLLAACCHCVTSLPCVIPVSSLARVRRCLPVPCGRQGASSPPPSSTRVLPCPWHPASSVRVLVPCPCPPSWVLVPCPLCRVLQCPPSGFSFCVPPAPWHHPLHTLPTLTGHRHCVLLAPVFIT